MESSRPLVLEPFGVLHPILQKLPEFLVRRLIRRGVATQLRYLYGLSAEEQLQGLVNFVQNAKQMPVMEAGGSFRDEIYDVDFFKLLLGKHLKYSCLLYEDPSFTDEQAEEAMFKLCCDRARIQDGQRILDLGGGYGGLVMYIAQKFPSCQITSIADSRVQTEHIREECRKRGLVNVEAIDCDITSTKITQTFDRIFCIGVFEHMINYQKFMKIVSDLTSEGGLLFVEHVCHKLFAYRTTTGNRMLADALPLYFQDDFVILDHWRVNGTHQGRSCEAWMRNLDAKFDQVSALFAKAYGEDNASKRLAGFRSNLLLGAEMFSYNNGQEWFVSHKLFQKRA
ncbi:(S)-coclaurine N-methyltransferase isoform X1 [Selaginella moellendorffii]|uniref:(S)-coclaurine N-methyltransferase isoform X1 n=1 Tax=Selaginella moellendorffii TaxID=88036 RepID=UPI000D1C86F3|nr:(S)-coclaurine N-methyltransferase isoform X1 [Selaginella moellendorffii]|eukprot:XP_024532291.1 (S)-coclaurine N-methyltransferase isoform X1 [Selaginella moellendorffii]